MSKIGKALNSSKIGGVVVDVLEHGIILESSNSEILELNFPENISEKKKLSFKEIKIGQFIHTQCKISGESINGYHKIYFYIDTR